MTPAAPQRRVPPANLPQVCRRFFFGPGEKCQNRNRNLKAEGELNAEFPNSEFIRSSDIRNFIPNSNSGSGSGSDISRFPAGMMGQ